MRYHKPDVAVAPAQLNKINKILTSGWVSIGTYCVELEEVIKKRTRVKHAIPCANATSGLIIALKAAEIKGWHINVPAFTWPSTVYAIKASGNYPVFVDIDKDTLLMNKCSSASSTTAAMPVDVFGNRSDPKHYDFDKVIIDAAHGFGIKNLGQRADAEVISFSHTKVVTGMEGGAILTNDDDIAFKARELVRLSARMGEINAYIALNSIAKYDKINHEVCEEIRLCYNDKINIRTQAYNKGSNPSVYSLHFGHKNIRDFVADRLDQKDIEYKIYYEPLVNNLPNTNLVYDRILCLPMYPRLTSESIGLIITTVNDALQSYGRIQEGDSIHSQYARDYLE